MGANGVRLGPDNRLEVVRTAPPEDPDHLREVLARLRAAAGPGVVEVVRHLDEGGHVEVVLAFAGQPVAGPLSGEALAPIAASLAAHLSDLHLRGLAHGAVTTDHVLVDATGAVRLCGLAGGAPIDDVLALGRLVEHLLDAEDRGPAAGALRAAVARCTVDDASGRPTMAAVAASLATIAPPRLVASPRRVEHRPPRRRAIAVAGAGAALAALIGVFALANGSRADPQPAPATTTSITTSSTTSTTAVRPVRVWPASAPAVFEHGGARWSFGVAGEVHLGRWACGPEPTPLLVDASGAVFVVDAWPDDGELESRYVTTVGDVTRTSIESEDGCDVLVVETADGRVIRPTVRA